MASPLSSKPVHRTETQAVDEPTVFVVDDDPAMRESLSWLLPSAGLRVEAFESAEDFLARGDRLDRPGCLLLDLRLPGRSGLDLQRELAARSFAMPIIFLTGYAEVPTAVRALKEGAFDFLEKPFSDSAMLDCVRRAIDLDRLIRERKQLIASTLARMERLSRREREVMELMIAGKATKVIAAELGLSPKTIEVHRGRVMRKMEVRALPPLVRLVMDARGSRV
jgi:FixJ family two-component response regulator